MSEEQQEQGNKKSNMITVSGGPAPCATKITGDTITTNPVLPQITAWLSGAAVMGVLILAYFLPIISELHALRYTAELKSDLKKLRVESALTYDWVNRRIELEKLQKEQANAR